MHATRWPFGWSARFLACLMLLAGIGAGCSSRVARINRAALDVREGQPERRAEPRRSDGPAARAADDSDVHPAASEPKRLSLPHTTCGAAAGPGPYRIGPGDVLQVQVYECLDTAGDETLLLEVPPSGEVRLPLVGGVQATGRTADEMAERVRQRLAADFIKEPQVSVSVKEYRSRQVTVIGAVERPGVFSLRQNAVTLLDALAMAGGISERAAGTVYVTRAAPRVHVPPEADAAPAELADEESPADASPARFVQTALFAPAPAETPAETPAGPVAVTLSELLAGAADQDPVLADGDMVRVPEAPDFFVTGLVAKPGAYPMRRPTTVLQAIATAGGMTEDASPEATRLIRTAGGMRRLILIPLGPIADGRAEDLGLEPNDVIEVGQTAGKRFWTRFGEGFSRVFGIGINVASF